jgi:hypothetical protein
LKKVQELLEAEAAEPLLLVALRGDRALNHEYMHALKSRRATLSQVAGSTGGEKFVTDLASPSLAQGSHGRVLRLMTEAVETAKLPPERQAEPAKELEAKLTRARVDHDVVIPLVIPSLQKIGESSRRLQAYLRCAIAGVAAERYRRDHGRWPAALGALTPDYLGAVPADPFDGQPLRYKRLADGLVVYSVGPDKEDNGGAMNRHNNRTPGTDMGFRLWDVDRRRQPAAEVLPQPDESEP